MTFSDAEFSRLGLLLLGHTDADVLAIQREYARRASEAPFHELMAAIAALPDGDYEASVVCADGVTRVVRRKKAPSNG